MNYEKMEILISDHELRTSFKRQLIHVELWKRVKFWFCDFRFLLWILSFILIINSSAEVAGLDVNEALHDSATQSKARGMMMESLIGNWGRFHSKLIRKPQPDADQNKKRNRNKLFEKEKKMTARTTHNFYPILRACCVNSGFGSCCWLAKQLCHRSLLFKTSHVVWTTRVCSVGCLNRTES